MFSPKKNQEKENGEADEEEEEEKEEEGYGDIQNGGDLEAAVAVKRSSRAAPADNDNTPEQAHTPNGETPSKAGRTVANGGRRGRRRGGREAAVGRGGSRWRRGEGAEDRADLSSSASSLSSSSPVLPRIGQSYQVRYAYTKLQSHLPRVESRSASK